MKTPQEEKDELIGALRENRRQIIAAAMRLPPDTRDEMYLGEWSVKDLLAHLEGWDTANKQAVNEILAGQLPAFYQQIDKDWQTFNASLVKRYRKEDLGELVGEVETSHRALLETLEAVPAESLDRDYEVRYKGWKVTVSRLMNAELSDEIEHLDQLSTFLERCSNES
jgi:hypothetical protein